MKEALLETAVDHFGRLGFEGASTRDIARASGTAMSSITYHFGGKDGLYLAAAEHIARSINAYHGSALEEARQATTTSPGDAIEVLLRLLDGFAQMMLSDRSRAWSSFIIREQQAPTEAFDRIFEITMRPITDTFAHLIAIARPDLSRQEVQAAVFFVMGQALGLRAARASMCRMLDLDEITPEASQFVRRRLLASARASLSAMPENA